MPWLQITLDIKPEQSEEMEDLLLAIGACSVTFQDAEDQPVFEPALGTTPLWSNTKLLGLFDATFNMELVVQYLKNETSIAPFPKHKVEILEDKDWEREWMENFHPMQFGTRLWVCPSWKPVVDPNGVNLLLDPGLAFGTGTHPTTALCLSWLDGLDLNGKTLCDYGCGSGILAIAGLLLGADSAIGVDTDPQALEASQENARRNKLAAERLPVFLPEHTPTTTHDIVVANILAGPLTSLAATLANLVKPSGLIALSGILSEQAQEVVDAYQPWFDIDAITEKDGWVRISGTKRP